MKTSATLLPLPVRTLLRLGAGLVLLPLAGFGQGKPAKEPVYDNALDLVLGHADVQGDVPAYQKNKGRPQGTFGGIENLYFIKELANGASLTIKGRALAGAGDYLFDLRLAKDELGYVNFGYRRFRVWYDGSSTLFTPNLYHPVLFDEDLHIDRSNLWFEAGRIPEDGVEFVLRYDLFTRKGLKDSTSWGDSNLTGGLGTKGVLPAFWRIDEKRHQLGLTASRRLDKSAWELAARYDRGTYDNSRNVRRRAGEGSVDRAVTTKDGRDYDLFLVRGSYENQVAEKLKVTTSVLHTKIDTTLSGSRIYGPDYDAVYDPAFARRQQRDEGYLDLHGETETRQTVGTISALYQPTPHWSIVPAVRFERLDWDSVAEFMETNFGAPPATAPINDEVEALSDKAWKNRTQTVEVRYNGIPNWTFNAKGEFTQSDGELSEERIVEPGTVRQAITIDRETAFARTGQKLAATANWYPRPGTTVAFQFYHKARQNDYRAVRDNTPNAGADRYPAYIANQDFETNDFNVRLSLKLAANLRCVMRYDYQDSTIRTQDVGLAFGESAHMTTHILAETVTWNPVSRWYVQGGANVVWDTLRTPAAALTGPAAGLVKNSDANYVNVNLGTGYALDDQTDLYLDYVFYRAENNYIDNNRRGVAYGTEGRAQDIALTWTRRLDRHTSLALKYTYSKYDDGPAAAYDSYESHLLYGKLQYRF